MKSRKQFNDFNFDVFSSNLSLDEMVVVTSELYNLRWKLDQENDARYYLENNVLSYENRKQLLFCTVPKNVSKHTLVVLFYLLKNKIFHKLGYFINVLKYYCANNLDLFIVEIIYRFKPNTEMLEPYRNRIEKLYGKKVSFVYKKVPEILGGFKLRWVSGEVDYSISKQIKFLEEMIFTGKEIS